MNLNMIYWLHLGFYLMSRQRSNLTNILSGLLSVNSMRLKYMNNKVTIIIGVIAIVLVGFFVFRMITSDSAPAEPELPIPTPTPVYQQVEDSVTALLTMNRSGRSVTLKIEGLTGEYVSLEYEVTYMTESGPKGTLSGSRPVAIDPKDKTFQREVELGSCSTGGTCTYYKGVRDFKGFIKFYNKDDEVFVLK